MFPEAARVFFHTSKYFVTWIPYSVACAFINFSFHPPSAHSAVVSFDYSLVLTKKLDFKDPDSLLSKK